MRGLYAVLFLLLAVSALEEEYSFERDNSPMARLARDFMPHIKTRDQLWEMEYQMRANMNEYFDRLLLNAKHFFIENGLDPLKLPDYIRTFSEKFLWITWHGELIVNNGGLQDLSTIYRSGNVNLDYQNRELLLDADIGFKDLKFGWDYSAKFMGIGPKGYIGGKAEDIRVVFRVRANLDTKIVKLEMFHIQEIGSIWAKLTGLGVILDWILQIIADLAIIIFKGPIMELLDKEVGNVLSNVLANVDIGSFLPQIYG